METYCEGSHCNKRDRCKLHHTELNKVYEYIDWSIHGGGRYWNDPDGTPHCETWTDCGIDGNHKMFIEVTDEVSN